MQVANDYGSIAGELAVCLRAVGLCDRSDLVKLDVHGSAEAVAAAVAAVAGVVPAVGQALHVRRAWWSSVSAERVFVLVDPSHSGRLQESLGAQPGVTLTDVSDEWSVFAVIGPRERSLLQAAGVELPAPGAVVELELAGAEVVLTHESASEVLLSVPPKAAAAVWAALLAAGAPLGVATVGREAHERFEVAAGLRDRRHDHSGW